MPYDWTSPAHSLSPAADEPPPSLRPDAHKASLTTTLAQIVAAIAIPFLGLGATRLVTTDTAASAPMQATPPRVLAEGFRPVPRLADPFAAPAPAFSSPEPKNAKQLTKTTVRARTPPKDDATLPARTRP